MGNLNIPSQQWLEEQFEFEFCSECGGDVEHHDALPLLGNWFARCKFPRDGDGKLHPVVQSIHDGDGETA